jgi:hypothetical protein
VAPNREDIKALINELENIAEHAASLGLDTVVFLLDMAWLDARQALDNAGGRDEVPGKRKMRR